MRAAWIERCEWPSISYLRDGEPALRIVRAIEPLPPRRLIFADVPCVPIQVPVRRDVHRVGRRAPQADQVSAALRAAGTDPAVAAREFLNCHSIKRLVCVLDGDDVEACGDDPLSRVLVDGIKQLSSLERADGGEQEVEAPASMAALFQEHNHKLARALKPKLFAAFDLREGVRHRLCLCGDRYQCRYRCLDVLLL